MKRYPLLIFLSINFTLLSNYTAFAQNSNTNIVNSCDRSSQQAFSTIKNIDKSTVAQTTSSAKNDTQPSLWWATEQFDPFGGRLVENWLTDTRIQQINLVVNWQLWTLLDYLGRYRFVNQFGTVARKYGYELNIFNQKKQCLATYKYNAASTPPKWEINLEQLGKNSLQIEPGAVRNTP
jgi:hypothetical protein